MQLCVLCWLHSFPHECATDLAHTAKGWEVLCAVGEGGRKRNDKNRKASLKNIFENGKDDGKYLLDS